jgi:glycosyltransferase involved in cell wall biosynthesis
MRVLAHIHSFNEAAFIEQVLDGLQRQTQPPDAIVIVDNGSTDETLDRTFPESVTVIRNSTDLGTTGSVGVGFAHALKHEFDWIWVLDADSVLEPSALENLLAFVERMPPPEREEVCFLARRLETGSGGAEHRPIILTGSGRQMGVARRRYGVLPVRLLHLGRLTIPDAGGREDRAAVATERGGSVTLVTSSTAAYST